MVGRKRAVLLVTTEDGTSGILIHGKQNRGLQDCKSKANYIVPTLEMNRVEGVPKVYSQAVRIFQESLEWGKENHFRGQKKRKEKKA